MSYKHTYKGSCHCENITITFNSDKAVDELPPRECACSFCQRHKGKYISDPKGSLEFNVADKSLLNRYRFGHKTADFIICKNCGVFIAATCEIDGHDYAVLNIRCILDQTFSGEAVTNNYDTEDKAGRLERRAKNWIGRIKFH